MSRFLSLILLLACLSLIVWFLPSTRNLNKDVGARIVGMWKVVTPEGVADGP